MRAGGGRTVCCCALILGILVVRVHSQSGIQPVVRSEEPGELSSRCILAERVASPETHSTLTKRRGRRYRVTTRGANVSGREMGVGGAGIDQGRIPLE